MADLLDIVTLDEAKRAINGETSNAIDDDLLGRHATAVSRLIDRFCGPVVQRTVTNEYHPWGHKVILLQRWPVASITTVQESCGGSASTLTALSFGASGDGYWAPPALDDPTLLAGSLFRRQGWGDRQWGEVQITYVAGRYADTGLVDARFKDAAGSMLRRLWKREAGTWAQSATFFDDNANQYASGFFQVAKPILTEMLWADMQPPRVA